MRIIPNSNINSSDTAFLPSYLPEGLTYSEHGQQTPDCSIVVIKRSRSALSKHEFSPKALQTQETREDP
jgi:hypothetical protein